MRSALTLTLALFCSSAALAQDPQPVTEEPIPAEESSSWEKARAASGEAWEATKEGTSEAWDATKEGAAEVYDEAKKAVQ